MLEIDISFVSIIVRSRVDRMNDLYVPALVIL